MSGNWRGLQDCFGKDFLVVSLLERFDIADGISALSDRVINAVVCAVHGLTNLPVIVQYDARVWGHEKN